MSSSDYEIAVAGFRSSRPQYTDPRIKVTGYLNTDGSLGANPTDDCVSGNLWVHGYPRGGNVQVLIGGDINPYVPNVRVWVGQNHARQAVAYANVIDRNAVDQWGPGLQGLDVPINTPTMALIEGRLQASTLGGLYVHVNSFYYEDQFFAGGAGTPGNFDATTYDFDLSADVPATVGYARWVRVYFDPADATLHSVAGSEIFVGGNVWLMDETQVGAIELPAGIYPTGAVALVYGQVDYNGAYFASSRDFISKNAVELNDIMMSSDGFGMVTADGFFMLRT